MINCEFSMNLIKPFNTYPVKQANGEGERRKWKS